MQVRIKTSGGQKVVKDLDPDSEISVLLQRCLPETHDVNAVEISQYKLLRGFPPQPLAILDLRQSIESLGIEHGDSLTFEMKNVESIVGNNSSSPHVVSNRDSHAHSQISEPRVKTFGRHVVPSDNSCLFTSINFCVSGKVDLDCPSFMRQLIASTVSSDPHKYSTAILGKTNGEYCSWILKDDSWGGAIESQILAEYFGVVITVIDSQTNFVTNFGENQNFAQRIFLIYDGIHYDPLFEKDDTLIKRSNPTSNSTPFRNVTNAVNTLSSISRSSDVQVSDNSSGTDMSSIKRTMFEVSDEQSENGAMAVAKAAKDAMQFTDVTNFKLKCLICSKRLRGQSDAQVHAKETGHTNFGESKN